MAQQNSTSFPIDPFTTSGVELATKLNELNDANISSQSGTSRPAYALQGFVWSDITSDINKLKYYTGATDLYILEYDVTRNTAIINGGLDFTDKSKAIALKSSTTSGGIPASADLIKAELVVNLTDKKLFSKDDNGDIVELGGGGGGNPSGTVITFGGAVAPAGYLKCNGDAVDRTVYADLYLAIGDLYGAGDGSTTFNIPDLRGEFVRGFDDGKGVDSGRVMGSSQGEDIKPHGHNVGLVASGKHAHKQGIGLSYTAGGKAHTYPSPNQSGWTNDTSGSYSTSTTSYDSVSEVANHTHTINQNNYGTLETRPINIALLYCIKA